MTRNLNNLISAFRKRPGVRRAAPMLCRTTLCLLPLEDRLTPSAVGSRELPNLPEPAVSALGRGTANLIAFDTNTPTISHAKVGLAYATLTVGGAGNLYRGDLPAARVVDLQFNATGGEVLAGLPGRGNARWEQIIIGDLPNATDRGPGGHVKVFDGRTGANSDSDWKYVTVRRTVTPPAANDNGHGTHVAGTVGSDGRSAARPGSSAANDLVWSGESGDRSAPTSRGYVDNNVSVLIGSASSAASTGGDRNISGPGGTFTLSFQGVNR